jgi:hypothetical protein
MLFEIAIRHGEYIIAYIDYGFTTNTFYIKYYFISAGTFVNEKTY